MSKEQQGKNGGQQGRGKGQQGNVASRVWTFLLFLWVVPMARAEFPAAVQGAVAARGGSGATSHRPDAKAVVTEGEAAPPGSAPAGGESGTAKDLGTDPASGGAAEKTGTAPAGGAAPAAVTAGTAQVKAAALSGTKAQQSAALLQAEIAKLPALTGTNIDVAKRSGQILQHLNSILRFYRTAVAPVQKVGEPSDVLYAEQSSTQALAIAQVAFQAAQDEAALLSKIPGGKNVAPAPVKAAATPAEAGSESQRFAGFEAQSLARLATLQAQQAELLQGIARAKRGQAAALQQQEQQIEGGIELQKAILAALGRVASFSDAQTSTGLAGDIDRLQRSAPELLTTGTKPPAPPLLASLAAVSDAGVTTQASTLFELLSTLRVIDAQTKAIDTLHSQATEERTPFLKVLRATVQQGQALSEKSVDLQATPTTDAQDLASTRKEFDELTNTFQVLASATLPLSQELVLLENARGTLTTWRAAVNEEQKSIFRALLVRVVVIAVLLGLLALASQLWSRATVKYVSDLRRRRQLLFVRRAVVGFLTGLVLLFGFVTQFSSLATFAGFISAGIAVGLQSILLSVAAYFFIVGRYGVRVGDRITVAGVTGDVIEVGLVRFYMMELVGTGTELHSTGRVAVFANSILFQTGTPIYKQMPGTEYAWHELTAKLTGTADVPAVSKELLGTIDTVYAGYKERIEAQHREVEGWVGTALPSPAVESRLQLVDGGLQFAVLFPVEIGSAATTDQSIAEALVKAMQTDGPLKAGLPDLPVIKAAVKA